ncbi:MAG: hypothetical protein ACTHMY_07610 [Solirubrobacteraceae bacterium]
MVRRTLRLVLESEQDVDVIAEAIDPSAVLRHVGRHLPHVLVLDLRLPNGSSIEMIRQAAARLPRSRRTGRGSTASWDSRPRGSSCSSRCSAA